MHKCPIQYDPIIPWEAGCQQLTAEMGANDSIINNAKRVLREVLNAREKERRQEVTPPVARTRRARGEVSDDDEGDDDDNANRVGVGAAA